MSLLTILCGETPHAPFKYFNYLFKNDTFHFFMSYNISQGPPEKIFQQFYVSYPSLKKIEIHFLYIIIIIL